MDNHSINTLRICQRPVSGWAMLQNLSNYRSQFENKCGTEKYGNHESY